MPVTGWSQVISPYAAVWGPGASIYSPTYGPGSSIYAAAWIPYENGQPIQTAPVCVSLPVVSGTAQVGLTLSCTTGTWTGGEPISYAYLWIRDTGGSGTPIAGATSSTYVLQSADNGYTVHCQVTATNASASGVAQSGSSSTVTWVAPVNTVLPVISGSTVVGQTLSTTDGTWTSTTSVTYGYQWKRSGSAIGGATSSTYTLVAADLAATITVTVTATNGAGSTPATSSATGTVTEAVPVNTVAPVASGYIFEMKTLSVTTGTWTSVTTPTYTYQWKRNGSNITSATSSSYTVVEADENQNITCSVTATNTAGGASATSNTLADWTPYQDTLKPYRWLQANRQSSINSGAPADNDAVGTWVVSDPFDGTTVSLTQSTAGSKPTFKLNQLNGMPVVRFNGAGSAPGQFLSESSTNWLNRNASVAILFVVKCSAFPVAYQYLFCMKAGASTSNPSCGYSTNASYKDVFFGDDVSANPWAVNRFTSISNINTAYHYIYITYNGSGAGTASNYSASSDNSALTRTGTSGNDGVQNNIIGNYKTSTIYGWTGDVAELLVLPSSVISSNYATYFNKKYGL